MNLAIAIALLIICLVVFGFVFTVKALFVIAGVVLVFGILGAAFGRRRW